MNEETPLAARFLMHLRSNPNPVWMIRRRRNWVRKFQLDITLSFCSSSQKVTSLNGRMESVTIPTSKKADLKAKVSVLQVFIYAEQEITYFSSIDNQPCCLNSSGLKLILNCYILLESSDKAKKKIAEENIQKAIKAFCISRVNVGLDTLTILKRLSKSWTRRLFTGIAVMVFSTDETANKALVCAGVPKKGDKCKQLKVLKWLVAALKPLKGKGGGGKCGLAQASLFREYCSGIKLTDASKNLRKKFATGKGKNQSVVYVGVDGTLASLIYVEDQIREDGRHVVESLHKQGVSLYILSWAKRSTTEYVASKVLTILVIENLERNVDSMVWVLKSYSSLALRLIYVLQDSYFLVV
ncbi:Alanine--tRNA ligase [Camellia lanceoleosa]|uniref:Alanine--tRNA ligase n=1 Tax=Camellia lanceoleosa TaxID=1840588 RepID=A0ACC0FAG1_9ERIC|nr:Alanine--tRNA ligase [Camellia lanceoleosa]